MRMVKASLAMGYLYLQQIITNILGESLSELINLSVFLSFFALRHCYVVVEEYKVEAEAEIEILDIFTNIGLTTKNSHHNL